MDIALIANQFVKIESPRAERHLVGIELRLVDNVIENVEQRFTRTLDGLEVSPLIGQQFHFAEQIHHPSNAISGVRSLWLMLASKRFFFLGYLQDLIVEGISGLCRYPYELDLEAAISPAMCSRLAMTSFSSGSMGTTFPPMDSAIALALF